MKLDDPLARTTGVAKFRQIYLLLRQGIDDGTYGAGKKLPSENELVKQLSASRPTIGRALAQLESEGLIQRKAGSGTFVASQVVAANLTFGLLIPDLGVTEVFEPICQGISQSRPGGNHDLIWGPLFDPEAPKEIQAEKLCEHYLARRPSGVFFAPLELSAGMDAMNQRIAQSFEQAGIPLVLLDRDICAYPERSRFDIVGIDNHRAGQVVTRHLLDTGARRIVYFSRPRSAATVAIREIGYRSAIEERREEGLRAVAISADPRDAIAVERMMSMHDPDAIVCANDFTAAQLMTTFAGLGVGIPSDVRITGMDDLKYASMLQVPLTSIRQPCLDIGLAAMAAMQERVARPDMPGRSIFLDFRLMVRASSTRAR